jgi:hypothetical protein
MIVEIELNDGTTITPAFSPEHYDDVVNYYTRQFINGSIVSWMVL